MPRVYLTPRGRVRSSAGLGPIRASIGRTGVRAYPSRRGSFGIADLIVYSMAAMLVLAVVAVVIVGFFLWLVGVLSFSAYKTYSVPRKRRVMSYRQRVAAHISLRRRPPRQ